MVEDICEDCIYKAQDEMCKAPRTMEIAYYPTADDVAERHCYLKESFREVKEKIYKLSNDRKAKLIDEILFKGDDNVLLLNYGLSVYTFDKFVRLLDDSLDVVIDNEYATDTVSKEDLIADKK